MTVDRILNQLGAEAGKRAQYYGGGKTFITVQNDAGAYSFIIHVGDHRYQIPELTEEYLFRALVRFEAEDLKEWEKEYSEKKPQMDLKPRDDF